MPRLRPVTLSTRFAPVDPDDPGGDWDWSPVIHHGRDCPVVDDDAARHDLGTGLLTEMALYTFVAHYGVQMPDHTAMAAP